MHDEKADARLNIELNKWSKLPEHHTLNISERAQIFQHNVEVKLEINNTTSKKEKLKNKLQ